MGNNLAWYSCLTACKAISFLNQKDTVASCDIASDSQSYRPIQVLARRLWL